jgi:transposase IS4-like protein/DDE family transposase
VVVVPVVHSWIGLSDEVRLGVLTRWVTPELVDETLAACGKLDRRPGALSARFMVNFILALALFHQDSYDDVAENLVNALPGMGENIPNRASFTRARQRLGPRPLEAVFRAVAGPVAPDGLVGSFYRGLRLAAVDGFLLDVPDTDDNRRALGGPSDARGNDAGFPQVRVVTLTETGTHASIDARVGGFKGGERELAIAMAGSATGMLVIMDRGFPGVELRKAYTQAGAHLLIRARSSVARRPVRVLADGTYLARMNLAGQKGAHPGGVLVRVVEYQVDGGEVIRLLTDLLDPDAYPAAELAAPLSRKVGGGVVVSADQDFPTRSAAGAALGRPGPGTPGGVGPSDRAPLPDQDHHGVGRRARHRPGPCLVHQGPQACPP